MAARLSATDRRAEKCDELENPESTGAALSRRSASFRCRIFFGDDEATRFIPFRLSRYRNDKRHEQPARDVGATASRSNDRRSGARPLRVAIAFWLRPARVHRGDCYGDANLNGRQRGQTKSGASYRPAATTMRLRHLRVEFLLYYWRNFCAVTARTGDYRIVVGLLLSCLSVRVVRLRGIAIVPHHGRLSAGAKYDPANRELQVVLSLSDLSLRHFVSAP